MWEYINPIFEEEELKVKRLPQNTNTLQVQQNHMIRLIYGLKQKNHVNMQRFRESIHMMSVNQMATYHTLLEAFNVIENSSSEQIKKKWTEKSETNCVLRNENDLLIPKKPKKMFRIYRFWV